MKTNLKMFPKLDEQGLVWTDDSHTCKLDTKEEIEKWKEAFEEELREILKHAEERQDYWAKDSTLRQVWIGVAQTIKEILGE